MNNIDKYFKDKESDNQNIIQEWIVTYGDLMGLLTTFFVFFYSIFTLEKVPEFNDAMRSFQNRLNALTNEQSANINAEERWLKYVKHQMQDYIIDKGLKTNIRVESREQGLSIIMTSPALFDLGSAEIKEDAYPILNEIYELVKDRDNTIWVEGHTDNLPIIGGEFKSNWELSAVRAINVIRYFMEQKDIDPKRLVAVGYGEHRPAFPNDTEAHRMQNRRVEITILRTR